MSSKSEWLDGLKEGDRAIEKHTAYGTVDCLVTVSRLTPTQIVTQEGAHYRRTDASRVGRGQSYHAPWLEEATAEAIAKIKVKAWARQFKVFRWDNLPLATLEAVAELVSKAEQAKAGKGH